MGDAQLNPEVWLGLTLLLARIRSSGEKNIGIKSVTVKAEVEGELFDSSTEGVLAKQKENIYSEMVSTAPTVIRVKIKFRQI